jgi:5-methylcytosine-specific restriction enzyme B
MSSPTVPVFQEYINPILAALRGAGGSATIPELEALVINEMKLAPEVLSVPHDPAKEEGKSEVAYRIAWARSYLKKAGLLENPQRGVWSLTHTGASAGVVDEYALAGEVAKDYSPSDKSPSPESPDQSTDELPTALSLKLRNTKERLETQGLLIPPERLKQYYATFRQHFGPEVLAGLDGERLLLRMHERRTHDSLVYWLEFKDDDELPAHFGSISGGSALKFGIYQSTETSLWMTGSPQSQKTISLDEAVKIARDQRDQLLRGAEVLGAFSVDPVRANYNDLERQIVEVAPSLANTAWGHKYFSLLFPELLDDYHVLDYQEYHLLKLLRAPLVGRYENAREFLKVAREMGWPVNTLTSVLNATNGSPHQYWRVDISERQEQWPAMKSEGMVATGWGKIADLTDLTRDKPGHDRLKALMSEKYPDVAQQVSRQSNELFNLVLRATVGDLLIACHGAHVYGIGRISGEYLYAEGEDNPHRRPVTWLSFDEWSMPQPEGLKAGFSKIGKHAQNIIALERMLLRDETSSSVETPVVPSPTPQLTALQGTLGRIDAILRRKNQVILYGPPGTGKTYWAMRAVHELAARSWFKRGLGQLTSEERESIEHEAIAVCCFHPAYGYEDFIEGYRPERDSSGQLAFALRDGVFKHMCERATNEPRRAYFVVIDEVNRGDVPRIFGELMLVLEKDRRGSAVLLPVSGQRLVVPGNLFLVATMNTADRSVALLDAALRRRFGFIELLPDTSLFKNAAPSGFPLGPWLEELNQRVLRYVGRDARNLVVGHSYLLDGGGRPLSTFERFAEVLRDDIVPLLMEYCYEDFDALEKILGSGLVQRQAQRINEGLFDASRLTELKDALLTAFDTITATPEAVEASAGGAESSSGSDDGDEDLDESVETSPNS